MRESKIILFHCLGANIFSLKADRSPFSKQKTKAGHMLKIYIRSSAECFNMPGSIVPLYSSKSKITVCSRAGTMLSCRADIRAEGIIHNE